MHRCQVRSRVLEVLEVRVWVEGHEVAVEFETGRRSQRRDDRHPKRDVRHKMPVHDVHMEQVDRVLDSRDLVAQVGKVGGQNGRCDAR